MAGCVLDIKIMIKLDDIFHKFLYSLFDEVLLDPIAQNDCTDDVINFVGTKKIVWAHGLGTNCEKLV